jgi:hypothetical protein
MTRHTAGSLTLPSMANVVLTRPRPGRLLKRVAAL